MDIDIGIDIDTDTDADTDIDIDIGISISIGIDKDKTQTKTKTKSFFRMSEMFELFAAKYPRKALFAANIPGHKNHFPVSCVACYLSISS
jgi:hypothetical protein